MSSQFEEDQIIEEIFNKIGTTNKFYIEIGCHPNGDISNTLALREKGWIGYWFDAVANPGIVQKFFDAENVNEIMNAYVPLNFDFLSLDIDGNDYYVWKEMTHKPRVVCIEYNINRMEGVIDYDPKHKWNYERDFGASKDVMLKLAEEKGYTFYKETQANLFFILNENK